MCVRERERAWWREAEKCIWVAILEAQGAFRITHTLTSEHKYMNISTSTTTNNGNQRTGPWHVKECRGVKRLCNVQLVCFLSSRTTAIKPCFKCDKFFQSKFCQTMLNIKYNNVLSGFSENTTISYFSAQRLSNSVGNKIAMRWISWHCQRRCVVLWSFCIFYSP